MDELIRTELSNADLFVEKTYSGGDSKNFSGDPLPPLLKVSNQGGFRYRGKSDKPELIVLTTTLNDADWPDNLDRETGIFTYYGDNKSPGSDIHEPLGQSGQPGSHRPTEPAESTPARRRRRRPPADRWK